MALTSAKTADGRIAYLAAGPAEARPVVFLHGIGGAARIWAREVETFGDRFRALAWDMPGYGGSAPLAETTIAALSDALGAMLADLGIARPILVGHSIGGMIVQRYLAAHPDGADAIALVQTSPAFGGRDPAWAEAFIAKRLGPLDRGRTMPDLAPAIVAELVGPSPDPAGIELARDCMAAVPEASYRASVKAMIGFDERANLDRIAVPTLVLAGSEDRNAPAAAVERMAGKIAGARYVCLPECGHLANLEKPAAFAAALRGFLDGLPATA